MPAPPHRYIFAPPLTAENPEEPTTVMRTDPATELQALRLRGDGPRHCVRPRSPNGQHRGCCFDTAGRLMSVADWLTNFGGSVAAGDLKSPAATALASFVERHATNIAKFIEARRGEHRELLVLEFRTGKPQDSVYPIRRIEHIGIRFAKIDALPVAFILRDDFPDTDHQLLTRSPVFGSHRTTANGRVLRNM